MSTSSASSPENTSSRVSRSQWRDFEVIRTVGVVVIALAATWYLMLQLAPILRPLLIATFLAYILMPYHVQLRCHVGTPASLAILAGSTALLLVVVGLITYASLLELADEIPTLQQRAVEISTQVEHAITAYAPWLNNSRETGAPPSIDQPVAALVRSVVVASATTALEACVVALYLLFLLIEGSRLPERVRRAYTPQRAEEILQVADQVNAAALSYLRAKIRASLLLAVPVGIVLWIMGVKFWLLWMVLTFLGNFIPYIGSVIAYLLPVGFAFLWFGLTWPPVVVAILLLVCHLSSSAVIEPLIIGHAVGVSPLVILGSLAFWGLVWGLPGMFLAVPLTVVATLVMEHFEQTRPIARLLKGV
ncbi:MAG: AI-2E family transporter [Gemmataceae bacterium]|nr:AI-2E family transporter [Gemmata sp.]MDW8198477.1 AI-2E family transporter [Gemmataceae bacterium]